jgi:hypothetical protein
MVSDSKRKWNVSIPNFEKKAVNTQRVDFAQLFLQGFQLRFWRPSLSRQRNKLTAKSDEPLVDRYELIREHGKIVLQSIEHRFYTRDEM